MAACGEVEFEESALDGAVEEHHAAAFFEVHGARELHIGRQHPRRPAGVLTLPVSGQTQEEVVGLVILELLTASAGRRIFVVFFGVVTLATVFDGAFGVDPLAVGRVEHHDAALAGNGSLQGVSGFELDGVQDTRTLSVTGGEVGHPEGDVTRVDGHLRCALTQLGGLTHGLPRTQMATEGQELFKGKVSQQTGGNVASDLGCLDGNGASATAGIKQGAIFWATLPACGCKHGCGQCFFERGFAFVFTPTAFEQGFARGVDIERGCHVIQMKDQAHVGETGIDVWALAGGFSQIVTHRIFDAQTRKVEAAQWAVARGDVHTDGVTWRDPVRPADGATYGVDVVLMAVDTRSNAPQDALREAAFEVEPHGVLDQISLLPRLDFNAPTRGLNHDVGPEDASDFFVQKGFNANRARQVQRDGTVSRQDRAVACDSLLELTSLWPRRAWTTILVIGARVWLATGRTIAWASVTRVGTTRGIRSRGAI